MLVPKSVFDWLRTRRQGLEDRPSRRAARRTPFPWRDFDYIGRWWRQFALMQGAIVSMRGQAVRPIGHSCWSMPIA